MVERNGRWQIVISSNSLTKTESDFTETYNQLPQSATFVCRCAVIIT